MQRTLGSLIGAALIVIGTAVPAGAARTPAVVPAGGVKCGVTGSVKFSPNLPSAANPNGAPGNVRVKLKAALVNCKGSGNAAAVTGGTIQLTTFLDPGSSCSDLLFGAPNLYNPGKLQAKWTGGDPAGTKHPTVGTSKFDSTGPISDYEQITGGWELTASPLDGTAFANQNVALDILIDNIGAVGGCAFGSKDPATGQYLNLTEVDFSAKGGSTLTVTP